MLIDRPVAWRLASIESKQTLISEFGRRISLDGTHMITRSGQMNAYGLVLFVFPLIGDQELKVRLLRLLGHNSGHVQLHGRLKLALYQRAFRTDFFLRYLHRIIAGHELET